jgi:DNA-binding SARP family transcriptional activator
MATRINLLSAPTIEVDGTAVAGPRGSKSWAVLAYLVLTDRPVPRARLFDLLFDEADDPAGALRWTLSQLRRALGDAVELTGDPVGLVRREDTVVDVDVLASGAWPEALAMSGFGGGLLEGISLRVNPAFELWLSGEQRRVATATASTLHAAAHSRLAAGDTTSAVELARRLVACDPLDEYGHELLVRTLVAAGDPVEAAERVRQCEGLFRRELGRPPSPALRDALSPRRPVAVPQGRSARLAAIEVGVAASQAGVYDRAIEVLRGAVDAGADEPGELSARALAALGTALVHGVRGSDEEAVSLLHRAFAMAIECGARPVAAQAAHELGVVETLRGHYDQMESWFAKAAEFADGDARLLAWINVYAGFGRTDQADYAHALATLELAQELARSGDDQRALAYADTGIGRLHLLRGELSSARAALDPACAIARELGWTSFIAFPESQLAEVDVLEGNLDVAEERFEHSYAVACQVGDPCWESYALRGRGLLAEARGDDGRALELLATAPRASRRLPDTHAWVEGYCLEALCHFAVRRSMPEAHGWVDELEEFASRLGMRELVARAALHRLTLGDPGADQAAALQLAGIDNPALTRVLTAPVARGSSVAPRPA